MNSPRDPHSRFNPAVNGQSTTGPFVDPEDPRVIAAVEEYMAELEAGRRPERQQFLARYPAIASVLAECLDGLKFLHSVSSSLDREGVSKPLEGVEEGRREPLGDFRILREVGRGGMGIVYEAIQLSLGRRVALKVLPLAAALDSRQLQRFRNEAQAAAQLHHTNIVPVYAVGSDRGVHYYAMQFIEGRSLAALIAEARGSTGKEHDARTMKPGAARKAPVTTVVDPRPVSARQTRDPRSSVLPSSSIAQTVARLGVKAAEALEHAHQVGVVHRDIKPGNLLLDDCGNLWITDFGLALFQSDAELTMTGEVLGTLRYMAPEQALGKRGSVDHRADVYSLGTTLYELLTLRPVFDGQDRNELLHKIGLEDPIPPRRIDPSIPVELETILLKAMAKAPADRYASAQEMADDLQRFLDHRPIRARRPTLVERATKWGRRHRSLVTSAMLLLCVAAVGLLTSTVLIAREQAETQAAYEREHASAEKARKERANADKQRTRADEQRALALEYFHQAQKAVDSFARLALEMNEKAPTQGVRRQMLELALVYYQGFLNQDQDPQIQMELAESQTRVMKLLDELSAMQGSGQLFTLKQPTVQDDLKLSEKQRQRVSELFGAISGKWRKAVPGMRTLGEEKRRAKLAELGREEKRAVESVLTVEQGARFREVLLQVHQQTPWGFTDPEVVGALKLTAAQRDKIQAVYQAAFHPMPVHHLAGLKKGRPWPGISWKAAYEKALTVLTSEQQAKWRELTGAPLKGEVHFPPMGLMTAQEPREVHHGHPSGEMRRTPGLGRFGNLPWGRFGGRGKKK